MEGSLKSLVGKTVDADGNIHNDVGKSKYPYSLLKKLFGNDKLMGGFQSSDGQNRSLRKKERSRSKLLSRISPAALSTSQETSCTKAKLSAR